MKLIKTLPLVLGLMFGAAHAEQKNVTISVEAPGFSSALTTKFGRSAAFISGEPQPLYVQTLCVNVDVNPGDGVDKLTVMMNTARSTTVTVLPLNSDAKGVRAYVGFIRQEREDPKLAVFSSECNLPTGFTSSTRMSMFYEFTWGEPKKIKLANGESMTITINNPEAADQ